MLCLVFTPGLAAAPHDESVHGRRVESRLSGPSVGTPIVVLENGARMTLDYWSSVIDGLGPEVKVLAYNRAGYGRSERGESPRSGEVIVEELRALLAAKGLNPPYVLVGHSLGGLYMQWFARRYPQDVQALVLVDALYPRVVKKPEDFPWYARLGKRWLLPNVTADEVDQIHATGEAVLAMPGFDDSRVVQLFNAPKSKTAVAVNFGVIDERPETREFVRQLYPRARRHVVDSDHQIQTDKPALVVSAIREAMALGAPAKPAHADK